MSASRNSRARSRRAGSGGYNNRAHRKIWERGRPRPRLRRLAEQALKRAVEKSVKARRLHQRARRTRSPEERRPCRHRRNCAEDLSDRARVRSARRDKAGSDARPCSIPRSSAWSRARSCRARLRSGAFPEVVCASPDRDSNPAHPAAARAHPARGATRVRAADVCRRKVRRCGRARSRANPPSSNTAS